MNQSTGLSHKACRFHFALCCVTLFAGCAPIQQCVDRGIKFAEAKHAYRRMADCPLCDEEERHFERGWRKGYFDVSLGKSGELPVVPPEVYWRDKYESSEGRKLVAYWYQGYEAGSASARHAGLSLCHRVPAKASCQACNRACCLDSAALPDVDCQLAYQPPCLEHSLPTDRSQPTLDLRPDLEVQPPTPAVDRRPERSPEAVPPPPQDGIDSPKAIPAAPDLVPQQSPQAGVAAPSAVKFTTSPVESSTAISANSASETATQSAQVDSSPFDSTWNSPALTQGDDPYTPAAVDVDRQLSDSARSLVEEHSVVPGEPHVSARDQSTPTARELPPTFPWEGETRETGRFQLDSEDSLLPSRRGRTR